MSLPHLNGFRMPKFSLGLVLALALATGCSIIGPTGTNKSTTVYKTPAEDGTVVISVPAPADAEKALFRLRNPADGTEFEDIEDSSPDGANAGEPCEDEEGFCVSFKADTLAANVYLMDVYIDQEEPETPDATVSFVVGGAADEEASGEETEEEGEEATEETEEEG